MRIWPAAASIIAIFSMPAALQAAPDELTSAKPTIVLVHGAFAGSSSWNGVIADLVQKGYPVVAAANPLRGVQKDAQYVSDLVTSVPGPVVLVGHSYGGEVISVAAAGKANVKALVFVAAFAPDVGESAASLGDKFPTGTLGQTLSPPVALSDGSSDLYIQKARYWKQFAADVSQADAVGMAATQRPIAQSALAEPVAVSSWQNLPSWFVWGSFDRNIPAALHSYMAKRAKARDAIEILGASHVVMVSHPQRVSALIEQAAKAR
jgi:pimeloyl-ACP methyl ester carboxylesterase